MVSEFTKSILNKFGILIFSRPYDLLNKDEKKEVKNKIKEFIKHQKEHKTYTRIFLKKLNEFNPKLWEI